jgi:MFS family permease
VKIFARIPVLQIRDFRILIQTRWTISMAMQIQAVVVGWQIYQIRPEALLLGLIGLAEAFPAIICSFLAGHIVDTHRPLTVYRISLLVLFLNSCVLWLVASNLIPLSPSTQLVLMYLAVFVSGAARSFSTPAVFALVPQLIPRNLIGASAALNSSAYQFASIVGPAIGGLVYGVFGVHTAFALIPIFAFLSLLGSGMLSAKARELKSSHKREPFNQSIRAGIQFVMQEKVLLSAMTLDMFSVLFGGAVAVLPIYADQVLHVGATGLGLLRAAPSLGSLIVALWMATQPMKVVSGLTLLWVVAGFGACILGFGISTNFAISLIFLAASGAFDGVSMVIRGTILQLLTPDRVRGRVSALSSVFITSSNEIGAFESGVAASVLGLVPSVVIGGAMTLVVVAITAWGFPQLRKTRIEH